MNQAWLLTSSAAGSQVVGMLGSGEARIGRARADLNDKCASKIQNTYQDPRSTKILGFG